MLTELHDYLRQNHITLADFAHKIGKSQGYISLLINGKRRASATTALKIEKETCGQISKEKILWPDE